MKPKPKYSRLVGYVVYTVLLSGLICEAETQKFEPNKKGKAIQSRSGDLVSIQMKKTGETAIINLTDETKVERKKDFRLRRADMDITAMVPGLTIDVEGVGNAQGQLDAKKIVFDPDTFAIELLRRSRSRQIEPQPQAHKRLQTRV